MTTNTHSSSFRSETLIEVRGYFRRCPSYCEKQRNREIDQKREEQAHGTCNDDEHPFFQFRFARFLGTMAGNSAKENRKGSQFESGGKRQKGPPLPLVDTSQPSQRDAEGPQRPR